MRALGIVLWVITSCATPKGAAGGGGDSDGTATFKVFYPDQPLEGFRAKVGKRFIVKPVATCTYENGRDGRWSMTGAQLESGELPDGFRMEEGTISGTPKAPGSWALKVRFSGVVCAGKQEEAVIVPITIVAK